MRASVEKSINKVKTALLNNAYQNANELGEECGLQPCSIYRIVKNMRKEGIGVLVTKNGYVLSKYAKKTDDVEFIRRVYGRRNSDFIAVKAAEHDISHRWNSLAEKKDLRLLISPLSVDLSKTAGMKVLLQKTSSGV
jgi:biotin operon repressor